jgi:hypothetical protein
MEFLLHFLTNSSQTHRPSVEQPSTNPSQQQQTQHHTILNQQIPTNSLKRKPAAIMLGEQPKKRTTTMQQHLLSRSQGIIINELTDHESGGWLHTTDTSPLVDLVPSPPPSITTTTTTTQHLDDNYPQTQQNHYEWIVPTDDLRHSLNFPQQNKPIGNGNHESNSYLTDFFLNTDNHNDTKPNLEQIDEANLTGINTVNIDADYFFDMI